MSDLTRTDGGLLVPLEGYEEAVRRALREHDDNLRLVPQDSDYFGRRIYKVFRYAGSDRPADFILFWGDAAKNEAYPLSMAIVDEVKRHDRGSRGFDVEDSDTLNARLREQRAREARELGEAIAEYHGDRMGDGSGGKKFTVLPTGRSLQLARMRRRRELPPELRP